MAYLTIADRFLNYITSLQDTLCEALEALEPQVRFQEDAWQRALGGGGNSRLLLGGERMEKACVNIGTSHGELSEPQQRWLHAGPGWHFTASLYLAVHPANPYAPALFAHFRYVELRDAERPLSNGTLPEDEPRDAYFSAGVDLAPAYLFREDAQHFHRTLAEVCGAYDGSLYGEFKHQADRALYLPHRKEARGIGGIAFEHLRAEHGATLEDHYELLTSLADSLPEAYLPLLQRRHAMKYQNRQRLWLQQRRARLAEFALMNDRHLQFQMLCDHRAEPALQTLPPDASWIGDMSPGDGTPEAELLRHLRPVDWLAE